MWSHKTTQAIIYVERESQAPILLGKGGAAIKQLSTSARMQIEEFLGRPVYLNMTVQVGVSARACFVCGCGYPWGVVGVVG